MDGSLDSSLSSILGELQVKLRAYMGFIVPHLLKRVPYRLWGPTSPLQQLASLDVPTSLHYKEFT